MIFRTLSTSTAALALALTGMGVALMPSVALAQAAPAVVQAQANTQWVPTPWVGTGVETVAKEVVGFRHHIHQHPELGNQEVKTAAYVAEHLKKLGLQVHTGIAGTGVVAVLTGKLPGPTVGLRADMDALPVKETSGLPFASKAKGMYFGKEVDLMHACGHDAHTAMLMSAATVMAANMDKIPGKVVFIFQPAEEGAADIDVFAGNKETWGARRMVEEGVLEKFGIDAVFGVHVMSNLHTGRIEYKSGAALNSADGFQIKLTGKQAHGSMPWTGADPIVAGADVVMGIQTIISRQANLSQGMGVISVGSINAGTAGNIIPGELTMQGTIRSNSPVVRDTLLSALPVMVENTAKAHHVQAEVKVADIMPVTVNNPELTQAMVPALQKASFGKAAVSTQNQSASEDFSYFSQKVPGLYVFLGVTPLDKDPAKAASNHNPGFFVDDGALVTGVRSHIEFVLGYAAWKGVK